MNYSKRLPIIVLALLVLFLAACTNDVRDSKNTTDSYGEDGFMGVSNANPNLPLTPGYHSYSKDFQLMRQTLNKIEGIKSSSISIQGADVYVKLNLQNNLSQMQAEQVFATAQKALSFNMPRYRIHIR